MNTSNNSALRGQAAIGLSIFVIGTWIAYEIGNKIAADDFHTMEFAALCATAIVVAVTILRKWRTGFYMFLVWLLFEDLVRKYLGNNMAIYFGKDVLVRLTYIALFVDIRRRRAETFRPPFR